jgi:uncharacterized protein (TIRG00374 family)
LRLAVNIALSGAMLGLCLWLVWPAPDQAEQLRSTFANLRLSTFWPYLATYVGLLVVTHVCRAYRWNYLLAPIDARQPVGRLLAISSVGFMAILALPFRLGEFVRPALIRKKGHISAAAALGTVAVERVVDGLMVSMFVFAALFSLRGPSAPTWMMPTAYAALAVFSAAITFLVFAMRAPERTVRVCVRLSGLRLVSDRAARALEVRLIELVRGFTALGASRPLALFLAWSLAYWLANGLGMWVLALGFGLDLSLLGALTTMGLVAVGITLPNSPGLVGQFQFFTTLGLSLFIGADAADSQGLAYAIALHGIQVLWYVGVGALALATPHVSLAEALGRGERKASKP